MSRLSRVGENGHTKRARRTSERILSAAYEVVSAKGYRDTRIEEIAKRAEVAPASIYNHFGSKAGISSAMAERALAVHETYASAAWNLDTSPLLRLIAAGGATLRFAEEEPVAFRMMALAYLAPAADPIPAAVAGQIDERLRLQRERLAAGLEDAVSEGELREMDVAGTAEFLLGAWTGAISMKMRPKVSEDTRRTTAAGLQALLAGLAGPRALTAGGALRPAYLRAMEEALA